MSLVDFILARLDEDERAARKCAEIYPAPWDVSDRGYMATVRADEPNFRVVTELEQAPSIYGWLGEYLEHIARHDPARVLADIDAKRRIVERFAQGEAEWAAACEDYSDWAAGTPSRAGRATTSVSRDGLNELARVLRLLALPYADHPDYDEAWRP